ncbi:MAG: shikimate dehydrogenase [Pseudomonadales bacterium]|nr:shikimate dehydrogenase [Pseudomonadales bacterium]
MSQSDLDQYAVMGNPVEHSVSPAIHSEFSQQTGERLQYRAILVAEDQFPEAVQRFFESGGKGLNITVPFKEKAFAMAEIKDQRAIAAGAANTLWLDSEQRLNASTTDGLGLLQDLTVNQQLDLEGKNVLVLGAGGAVRGVLKELLARNPKQLVISNRTSEKAELLAQQFSSFGNITCASYSQIPDIGFGLVINGTSASLHGKVPAIDGALLVGSFCYDMMYGQNARVFLDWAIKNGAAQAVDGVGMLVEQAAESFSIWRKVRPLTRDIICSLRKS